MYISITLYGKKQRRSEKVITKKNCNNCKKIPFNPTERDFITQKIMIFFPAAIFVQCYYCCTIACRSDRSYSWAFYFPLLIRCLTLYLPFSFLFILDIISFFIFIFPYISSSFSRKFPLLFAFYEYIYHLNIFFTDFVHFFIFFVILLLLNNLFFRLLNTFVSSLY